MGTTSSTPQSSSPHPSSPTSSPPSSPHTPPPPPNSPKTLNPVIVSYLRIHLKKGTKLTDKMFNELEEWIKVLGDDSHCSSCKKPLPTMDWQCCDLCPVPICDKCDICANCNIVEQQKDYYDDDACSGCSAPNIGGLCRDCRRDEDN